MPLHLRPRESPASAAVHFKCALWVAGPPLAVRRCHGPTAATLPDGKILVAGGVENKWRFGIAEESLSTEVLNLSTGSSFAAAVKAGVVATAAPALDDKASGMALELKMHAQLLDFLGMQLDVSDDRVVKDPDCSGREGASAWATGPMMTITRQNSCGVNLPDGRVMLIGGASPEVENGTCTTATTEVFNPKTNVWSTGHPLRRSRQNAVAAMLPDGQVMVMAGHSGHSFEDSSLKCTEVSFPGNIWNPGPELTTARSAAVVVTLTGGQVWVAGGLDGDGHALSSTEIYDPDSNVWASGPELTSPRHSAAATTLSDGRILLVGGADSLTVMVRMAKR